jgi:hypothetical protein
MMVTCPVIVLPHGEGIHQFRPPVLSISSSIQPGSIHGEADDRAALSVDQNIVPVADRVLQESNGGGGIHVAIQIRGPPKFFPQQSKRRLFFFFCVLSLVEKTPGPPLTPLFFFIRFSILSLKRLLRCETAFLFNSSPFG